MSKNTKTGDENLENVENALSKTEHFIEENQKSLTIIVVAIAATIGLYLTYDRFVAQPKEVEAQNEIFMAEQYFEQDSFNIALNGKDEYPGFLEIIDEHGSTKAANLAHYYAGVSYLRLGDYDKAIEYLKKFDSDDIMVAPIAQGSIGDAYSQLKNYNDAAKYYTSAADYSENDFTTPIYLMKAGHVYIELKEYNKALEVFNKIKKNYPQTTEGRQIDKYITKATLLSEK
ncbi:MAG: tetratricopeptide repeat protein [Bacteroidales bacterium]|jgi:tetratricopeptide (TPR) repeat protein|nr:tetratricopeptide repeat protein [Bacteroidales bacterium]